MMFLKDKTVYEESLDRIRMVYDHFDDVIVSISGGKDSTVVYNLAKIVAEERGKLPLKVFWLDQEAEWKHTRQYVESIMRSEDVEPLWCQIPFDFTNSLSTVHNFVRVWDESAKDKWIHPQADISIKENHSEYTRFHDLCSKLPGKLSDGKNIALLIGMRIEESPIRRSTIIRKNRKGLLGETWIGTKQGNISKVWPIWDWTTDDIWVAISRFGWEYNKVYDMMYQHGVPRQKMRVSALIHETAFSAIGLLQEFEPDTYNKFIKRVNGTDAMSHALEQGIVPKELPFAFRDWKEYRDYLLVNLVKPEYHELFRKRWEGQDGDSWYKIHVKECIINDIDGTINFNHKDRERKKAKLADGGSLKKKYEEELEEFKRQKEAEG